MDDYSRFNIFHTVSPIHESDWSFFQRKRDKEDRFFTHVEYPTNEVINPDLNLNVQACNFPNTNFKITRLGILKSRNIVVLFNETLITMTINENANLIDIQIIVLNRKRRKYPHFKQQFTSYSSFEMVKVESSFLS